MAQLELTLPQTHTQQEEQDRQDATRLFYSSLEVLAENDPDTSHNETATILNCTQEAERESRVEEHRVCEEIAGELCGIADQVDGVVQGYEEYFDQVLINPNPEVLEHTFLEVGREVFRTGITLKRICVMLVFTYKMVKLFLRKLRQMSERILGTRVTDFIVLSARFLFVAFLQYKVFSWVRTHGGWHNVLPSNWSTWTIGLGAVILALGVVSRYMSA